MVDAAKRQNTNRIDEKDCYQGVSIRPTLTEDKFDYSVHPRLNENSKKNVQTHEDEMEKMKQKKGKWRHRKKNY
uniref:Uncharacterized protein n=1 Tax=Tetranychus urticae TaxID=32264 RepID=T1K7B5_TETUR